MGRFLGALLLLAGLSACASSTPSPIHRASLPASSGAALRLEPVAFAEIPGWDADDQGAALAAFRQSCRKILALAPSAALGPAAVGGPGGGLAGRLPPGRPAAGR